MVYKYIFNWGNMVLYPNVEYLQLWGGCFLQLLYTWLLSFLPPVSCSWYNAWTCVSWRPLLDTWYRSWGCTPGAWPMLYQILPFVDTSRISRSTLGCIRYKSRTPSLNVLLALLLYFCNIFVRFGPRRWYPAEVCVVSAEVWLGVVSAEVWLGLVSAEVWVGVGSA